MEKEYNSINGDSSPSLRKESSRQFQIKILGGHNGE